jgi:hypothetical protein
LRNAISGAKPTLVLVEAWQTALTDTSIEIANELGLLLNFLVILGCIGVILYSQPEALSYEIFMWGDIGMVTDVRYYGVAPH